MVGLEELEHSWEGSYGSTDMLNVNFLQYTWKIHFRIGKVTFDYTCRLLCPNILLRSLSMSASVCVYVLRIKYDFDPWTPPGILAWLWLNKSHPHQNTQSRDTCNQFLFVTYFLCSLRHFLRASSMCILAVRLQNHEVMTFSSTSAGKVMTL